MSSISSSLSVGRMQADMASGDAAALKEPGGDREEIKKVANEFESLFINLVLKSMRNTVQKSGLIDGGNAEEIYKSMLDDEYCKQMATQRTTGIADQIEDFMLRAQGLAGAPLGGSKATSSGLNASGIKAYQGAALQNSAKSETMNHGASPLKRAL